MSQSPVKYVTSTDMIHKMQPLQSTVSIKFDTLCNFTSLHVTEAMVAPGDAPDFNMGGGCEERDLLDEPP